MLLNTPSKKLLLLIVIGFFLSIIISIILILAHPLYSIQSIQFPINEHNTKVSMDIGFNGKSSLEKIADNSTSGFKCTIQEDDLESSCQLEIWILGNKKIGFDLNKFQYLKLFANFNSPTDKDFLRIGFKHFEPSVESNNIELQYKYNLVELNPSELTKPIIVDLKRLIVPNWWLAKVRDSNVTREVDLTNIHYIEIATGLHASPGEYLLNVSLLELSRETISKQKLYEYLITFWAVSIIIFFIVTSMYLQFQIRKKLSNKKTLEEINESLSIRSEKLTIINQTDEMTSVLNRNGMEEKLKECLSNKWFPISIAMVDIDFFKKVNDVYGHQKGDIVLIALGKILNDFIKYNESVSRFGGEEFLIIIPKSNTHEINNRLEDPRKTIERHDMALSHSITVSIGVATCNNIVEFQSVIEQADITLYEAKNSGRNCVKFFDSDYKK